MANIKDVALLARVSVTTVSHVANNTRFVAEETRQRVMEAMQALNYVTNPVARSLRTSRVKTIGLLIPDLTSFFYSEAAVAIEAVLQRNGFSLLLCDTYDDAAVEKQQLALLTSGMVSGIIMAPVDAQCDYRAQLNDPSFPLVFIDLQVDVPIADSVLVDDRPITCEAVDYLIAHGHERIGFIKGKPGPSTTEIRLQGYVDAYRKAGLPIVEEWIRQGNSTQPSGFEAARHLVEKTEVTAIFASNSLMTLGAFQYLLEKKIAIPDRIALIGFGDYSWVSVTTPPLSVIRVPARQVGAKAAELVLAKIQHPDDPYVEVNLPAEFILRSSC